MPITTAVMIILDLLSIVFFVSLYNLINLSSGVLPLFIEFLPIMYVTELIYK